MHDNAAHTQVRVRVTTGAFVMEACFRKRIDVHFKDYLGPVDELGIAPPVFLSCDYATVGVGGRACQRSNHDLSIGFANLVNALALRRHPYTQGFRAALDATIIGCMNS